MGAIPVTLLYGGLLTVLVVLLGSWVSILRLVGGPSARIGKPNPEALVFPVRAHGNAAEWVPLGVLALLLLELARGPSFWLHFCGGSLVVLRLIHAGYALNRGRPFIVAAVVAVLHYCLLAGMGLWAVYLHFA
ncbi:MAG: MAPEG family protein [Myxococcaceae bacterium]|nr:MAPEG family protein [Myxococcaceae bacterium]